MDVSRDPADLYRDLYPGRRRTALPGPLCCRVCHCRDLRVAWTYRAADGSIRRRRWCRHCGHEFTTAERLLDDDRKAKR